MSLTAKYDQKTITNGLCRIDFPWKYILKIDNLTKRGWYYVGSFTTGFSCSKVLDKNYLKERNLQQASSVGFCWSTVRFAMRFGLNELF